MMQKKEKGNFQKKTLQNKYNTFTIMSLLQSLFPNIDDKITNHSEFLSKPHEFEPDLKVSQ